MAKREEQREGQLVDGSDMMIRLSLQLYTPDNRRYQEIKGTAIRIRFKNDTAIKAFSKRLRESISSLL